MRKLLTLLVLAGIALACTTPEKSGGVGKKKSKARIDSVLNKLISDSTLVGASALIFEDGKEVYFNAFGLADREANQVMDRNTLVRIYSMTKPVTGVALMSLYEKGAFQLDDPLSKYLPEFGDVKVFTGIDSKGQPILVKPNRPISIRDITRHTAGFATIPDSTYVGELLKEKDPMNLQNTLTEMGKRLAAIPLVFHPGEQWSYGISVDVQALLVEKLSGIPFQQYMQQTILSPLKMTNTGYVVDSANQARFAAMYSASKGKLNRVPDKMANTFNKQPWPLTPGGWGLTSTLDDYTNFAQMLVNEGEWNGVRILKPETIKLMATNQLADSVTERQWLPSKGQVGFGIDFAVRVAEPSSADENVGAVGEFFWDGAASTLFWVDPKNKLTKSFVMLCMGAIGIIR
jgi:CubicO group peptidase (beta-lactamase class C family)